jgi:hypothetical protein
VTTVQQNYKILERDAPKKSKIQMEYEEIFLEAVDEGLSLLGESAKQSIYFYLEELYGIKKNEIPAMTEEFAKALHNIFGLGSKIILIEIMKKLHENEQKLKFHKTTHIKPATS